MKYRILTLIFLFSIIFPSIEDFEGLMIKQVKVKGNINIPEKRITGLIESQIGSLVEKEKIKKDFTSLYETGLFEDVKIDLSKTNDGALYLIIVDERPKIKKIKFAGNTIFTEEEMTEAVHLETDSVFSKAKLKSAEESVRDKYYEKGYLMAKITPQVMIDDKTKNVEILFNIDEGSEVLVEKITFFDKEKPAF